jgi:hypothetical protein
MKFPLATRAEGVAGHDLVQEGQIAGTSAAAASLISIGPRVCHLGDRVERRDILRVQR